MPVIDREGGLVFYFFAGDMGEPPHVHVAEGQHFNVASDAKIWLEGPSISRNGRFNSAKMRKALLIVIANQEYYLRRWYDFAKGQR